MLSTQLTWSELLEEEKLNSNFSSYFKNCLSIAVDEEIDRDNYFYTVRTGSKVLGIFTREFNSDTFIARAFYHNPDNLKTQHKSFDEAVAAIVATYTGKVSCIPKPQQTTYHLTLETIEVDEFGIPDEQKVVVYKREDGDINWHLWVFNYSELIGEAYRLINVVKVDVNTSTEF
ncbi:MAG: hypothetical protein ACFBSE_09650 [Prochloraceae cyanobacterium]